MRFTLTDFFAEVISLFVAFLLLSLHAYAADPASLRNELREGSFPMQVKVMGGTRETKADYIIPLGSDGKPMLTANDLVFYSTFVGDRQYLKDNFPRRCAEEFGLSVFTVEIDPKADDAGMRNRYYCFPESGWHDVIFNAAEIVRREQGLDNRKLLVLGHSAGGSLAGQLGACYPDKVDAVGMIGGRFLAPLNKENAKVAWLSLNTWGCPGTQAGREFKKQADALGMRVLRGETAPAWSGKDGAYFHHAPSKYSLNAIQLFIRDVAKMRRENGGAIPNPATWPETREVAGETLRFGSEELASQWLLMPLAAEKALLDASRETSDPVYIDPPNGAAPKGLAFFVQDTTLYDSTLPIDNVYYLAERGFAGTYVELDEDCHASFERIKTALGKALGEERYKKLPVYVIGSGLGGELAASAALANGDKRIRKVTTFNAEFKSPIEKLSIATYRAKSELPLMMYFGYDSLIMPKKAKSTHLEIVEKGGLTFGKSWFKMVEAACAPEIPDAIDPPKPTAKSSATSPAKDSSSIQPKKPDDKKTAKHRL